MPTFLKKTPKEEHKLEPWKILVVDDEPDVHAVTSVVARDITFLNRPVKVYSAYSGTEAIEILKNVPGIALAIIDVVMETEHAGLEVVRFVREDLRDKRMRLVIRTGQPGYAPPREIILKYDINDYREKAELSGNALYTLIVSKLREYKDYTTLDKQRLLLSKLAFLTSLVMDLKTDEDYVKFVEELFDGIAQILEVDVKIEHRKEHLVNHKAYKRVVWSGLGADTSLEFNLRTGYSSALHFDVTFSAEVEEYFSKILDVFLNDLILEVENNFISRDLTDTLYKIVYIISEVTETRSLETGEHVRRVGEIAKILAQEMGMEDLEVEYLEIAAMLHDVGKVGIPDSILMKPSQLSEEEFEIMKHHTIIGHKILSTVDHPLFNMASTVALYHHENWDGTGYPKGLKGEEIPLCARIVSIIDFYDALRSDRVYRKAYSEEETLKFLHANNGKKFDPRIFDIFMKKYEQIRKLYQ
ncbi:HD domain-containing phosphohydrolase [Fervidobacterium thailandense]|uniref:Two-component system response regulator n=1 Tax=Fervidobacterium thailandense TaxID=1008305 RepID=A0A1E3G4A7_9BACT|nr:HD domain-containing phosphohydrolase [Fervidobacterium thailandense]ODN31105.1 two-component system response regulator [Fervidobacterium thailandense]